MLVQVNAVCRFVFASVSLIFSRDTQFLISCFAAFFWFALMSFQVPAWVLPSVAARPSGSPVHPRPFVLPQAGREKGQRAVFFVLFFCFVVLLCMI